METPDLTGEKEGFTLTNADGFKLCCRYWKPQLDVRALAFVSHGFAQHLEYYNQIGRRLSREGILAFGHDHVGHGRSEGSRVMISETNDYVRDVFQHVDFVKKQYPGLPIFLVGHSMGGLISVLAALENPELFTGMVLIAPFLMADKEIATPLRVYSGMLASYILPELVVGKMMYDQITRDKEMVEQIKNDQFHWQSGIKLKWAAKVLKSLKDVERRLPEVKVPFLTQHGSKDKIVPPDSSWILYRHAQTSDKEIKIYNGGYHSLFLDVEDTANPSIDDFCRWILRRIPETPDVAKDVPAVSLVATM